MSEETDDVIADLKAFNRGRWLGDDKARRIVNVSSVNAMRGKWGLANYSARAGMLGLTTPAPGSLKYGVNVNAIPRGWWTQCVEIHRRAARKY